MERVGREKKHEATARADIRRNRQGEDGGYSRRELGLAASDSSASVLIRAVADGDGIANGIHHVLAVAGGGSVRTLDLGGGLRGRR